MFTRGLLCFVRSLVPKCPGALLRALAAFLLFAAFADPAIAQEVGSIRGQVSSDSDGQPLASATIQLIRPGWSAGTTTNPDGEYVLSAVPHGRSVVQVRHIGHEPLEIEVVVAAGREVVLDVSLAVRPVALAPVRVEGVSTTADDDSLSAGSAQLGIVEAHALEATPGLTELGFAEAVRGVPGHEPPDPGSVLYVRGATSDLKLVFLDGAPVYAPFPLGGLLEPFAPELLHQANIYLGGAPARYDGGLSYVMDLRTRGGVVGGARTSGAVDLLTARLLAEAGLGDRLRVIGTVRGMHPLASSGFFDDPLPYGYREGVIRADARLTANTSLSVTGFRNAEAVRIGSSAARDSVVEWGNRAGSIRLRSAVGQTHMEWTAAFGDYAARLPLPGTTPLLATGDARRTRLSGDFSRRFGSVQIRYGGAFDRQAHHAVATRPESSATAAVADARGEIVGVYGEAAGQVGKRVSLRGGLRVDHFSSSGMRLGPRAAATVLVTERAAITLAAGTYHQFVRPPDEVLLRAAEKPFLNSLPSLTVGRASHFTLGLDQDLGDGLGLGVEGFFKTFTDVPGATSPNANASGVDLWVRRSLGSWTGWAGYSLAWAWSAGEDPARVDFSGRHLFSAGAGLPLGERTRLDLRFAYGAGLPYSAIPLNTPALASAVPQNYTLQRTVNQSADRGGVESAPLLDSPDRPFLRMDATLSQVWMPRRGNRLFRISPYVRVLNSLGRRDALFYYFDRETDDSPREIGTLPFIPMVGVEWKF